MIYSINAKVIIQFNTYHKLFIDDFVL